MTIRSRQRYNANLVEAILKVLLVSSCYLLLVMSFVLCLVPCWFPGEAKHHFKLPYLSAYPGSSEGVLWPETNAVQFPELSATTTCSFYQGHLQKGNFLSGVFIYIDDHADKGARLWTGTKVAF